MIGGFQLNSLGVVVDGRLEVLSAKGLISKSAEEEEKIEGKM